MRSFYSPARSRPPRPSISSDFLTDGDGLARVVGGGGESGRADGAGMEIVRDKMRKENVDLDAAKASYWGLPFSNSMASELEPGVSHFRI